MCVKLTFKYLNFSPYSLHFKNTYTCGVIIASKMRTNMIIITQENNSKNNNNNKEIMKQNIYWYSFFLAGKKKKKIIFSDHDAYSFIFFSWKKVKKSSQIARMENKKYLSTSLAIGSCKMSHCLNNDRRRFLLRSA